MLKSKPIIEFDNKNNKIRFEGIFIIKSYWEEDAELVQRIKDFVKDRDTVLISFSLFYLDSVSRKIFFELLIELKETLLSVKNLRIDWHYEEEDESIFELGDVMTKVLTIPFNFIKQE